MNSIVWLLALLLLGLATGRIVGAGLAFTGGRARYDLTAGLLGALVIGVPLRLLGLTGYSAALPSLIVGVSAAMLATWLTRIFTWKPEPVLRPEIEPLKEGRLHRAHDLMTTSGGTRLLLSAGRLGVSSLSERATQPTGWA
jgi:uncharacterized membrane protein YeaQ/YmgE (transglycosylase-associated protein family)